jgi:agmatinase
MWAQVHGERRVQHGPVDARAFAPDRGEPGKKDIDWMRANQVRYHFMEEIDRKGWDVVMRGALAEALDGPEMIFVSIDTDCLDPAYAPGMGTPEPGGLTPRELFPILRALGIQNKIVGIDLVEVNPLTDPTYRSGQVAVRILREILTGIAMRKEGITDPFYADSEWMDHGVAPPEK